MLAGHLPNVTWTGTSKLISVCKPLGDACIDMDPKCRPSAADVNKQLSDFSETCELDPSLGSQSSRGFKAWSEGLDLLREGKSASKSAASSSSRERKKKSTQNQDGQPVGNSSESGNSLASVPENEALDPDSSLLPFKKTPVATQACMLASVIDRWFCGNPQLDACCAYHLATRSLLNLARSMARKDCVRSFTFSCGGQCPHCLALMEISPLPGEECDVCGKPWLEPGDQDAAKDDTPQRQPASDDPTKGLEGNPLAAAGAADLPVEGPCKGVEGGRGADEVVANVSHKVLAL